MRITTRKPWAGYDGSQKPEAGWVVDPDDPIGASVAGLWTFGEAAGNLLTDATGANPAPLLAGPATWTLAPVGTAVKFKADTVFNAGAGAALNIAASGLTLVFRGNPTGNDLFAFCKGDSTTAYGYACYIAAGKIYFFYGANLNISSTGAICNGTWRTFAVTVPAGGGTVSFYADGKLDSTPGSATLVAQPTIPLYIGGRKNAGSFDFGYGSDNPTFGSLLDYVLVCNRALSAEEVARVSARPFSFLAPMPARRTVAIPGSDFTITPSGGLTLGGFAVPGVTFSPSPTGGLILGGAVVPATTFSPTPAGTLTLSGAVTPAPTFSPTPAGTLVLGGTATAAPAYPITPAGTLIVGGTAAGNLATTAASGVRLPPRHWERTPAIGYGVDPTHTLARNLVLCAPFSEAGGPPRNVITRAPAVTTGGTPVWNYGVARPMQGPARDSQLGGGIYDAFTLPSAVPLTSPLALEVWATLRSFKGSSPYISGLLSNGITGTAVIRMGDVGLPPVGLTQPAQANLGGTIISGTAIGLGLHHFLLTFDGTTLTFYVDGLSYATGTPSPSGSSATWYTCRDDTASRSPDGQIHLVRIWSGRSLSAAEVRALYLDPWGMFSPMPARYFGAPSANSFEATPSGTLTLGGSALPPGVTLSPAPTGTLILGGTPTRTISWAPAPAGTLVLGGSPTTTIAFAATPSGTLVLGGVAQAGNQFSRTPSGTLTLGGSALPPGVTFAPPPSGGIVLSGTIARTIAFAGAPSGSLVLGGAAILTAAYTVAPASAGTLVLGGSATFATPDASGYGPTWATVETATLGGGYVDSEPLDAADDMPGTGYVDTERL